MLLALERIMLLMIASLPVVFIKMNTPRFNKIKCQNMVKELNKNETLLIILVVFVIILLADIAL